MAVNPRQYVTVTPFLTSTPPKFADLGSFQSYLIRENQKLQATLNDLTKSAIQTLDNAPQTNPPIGAVRYAVGAWATALGGEGLYVLKGSGWTLIV